MKQIGLAMDCFHDANGWFPPAAICDAQGRPLLSWRVLLLPYLEEQELFAEFHLDEPWDSPHNLALLPRMPHIYRRPARQAEKDATIYRVFVGPGSVFDGLACLSVEEIREHDGTSKTLLVVEADEAVPWTKPEELPFRPGEPLPALGGLFKGEFRPFSSESRMPTFNVLFADGHVQTVPRPERGWESHIRGYITWNGGEDVKLP